MKILITGTSGQLGSALVEQMSTDHQVVSLDVIPGKNTRHVGSVADRNFVFSLMQGVDAVIHTASLHARHLGSHSRADFVDSNVRGTLNLLEAAVEARVRRFVYTSTTSLYGHALEASDRAVWVTEEISPIPRDIYDVTKIAAEGLCQIVSEQHGLPCVSLRVSRFFPEPEDRLAIYRLYRGVDVRDVVSAHLLALESALQGFAVFNISAHSPFSQGEVVELFSDPQKVICRHYPGIEQTFARRGWKLPEKIDRVYVTEKAERLLQYRPVFNFEDVYL